MKIGKYNIKIVHSGFFALDGGAMFGIIPQTLWKKLIQPDEFNRIPLAARNLLLDDGNKKILIDTGMGNKWNEKNRKIYKLDNSEFSLLESLKKLFINKEDITDVFLTHLHFDHTGGSTQTINNNLVPTFPNAIYHVQKKNFEWAMNTDAKDNVSYMKENFEPLAKEGILNLVEGNKNYNDQISFEVVNGHTFGHQMIKISDGINTLLYLGDLIPTSAHINYPYIMGYDLQPLITLEEKRKYIPKAIEEDWLLFFEHDPKIASAKISFGEKGIIIRESFENF